MGTNGLTSKEFKQLNDLKIKMNDKQLTVSIQDLIEEKVIRNIRKCL